MSESYTEQEKIQMKKNRRVILAIFGIPVLVLILSGILFNLVESKKIDLGTSNNGELIIPPLQFSELSINTLDGENFDYSQPDAKWSYVVVGDSHCTDACERMLYLARQSITALGSRKTKTRLIYLTTSKVLSDEFQERLKTEYNGINVVVIDKLSLTGLFAETTINAFQGDQIFIVDPSGWLMMKYNATSMDQGTLNALGKAIVKDMKRIIIN